MAMSYQLFIFNKSISKKKINNSVRKRRVSDFVHMSMTIRDRIL